MEIPTSLVDREPVIVNVYDMMAINDFTKLLGVGVFHSGVEVYGSEYAYGGHLSTFTGIYDMNPKDSLVLGEDFRYKCSFLIGHTPLTREEVQLVIAHLGKDYRGSNYSIVRKNCNHFTRDFCLMLTGRGIPRWINRLARLVSHVPYLGNYAERNMGISNAISQCCGSGILTAPEEDEEVASHCDKESVDLFSSSATGDAEISLFKNLSGRHIPEMTSSDKISSASLSHCTSHRGSGRDSEGHMIPA